jgi:hypothetical protein
MSLPLWAIVGWKLGWEWRGSVFGMDWELELIGVECSMGWEDMLLLYGYRGLEDSGHLTTFKSQV